MIRKIFHLFLFFSLITFFLSGCGIYKRSDVKDNPVNVKERVEKNIEEGKGIRFNVGGKKNSGVFDFASSNEMWRATIETLDFVSFTNASYSGGIIITDWYFDSSASSDESIKITVRFLSNNIGSESIKIIVHQRVCKNSGNCKIQLLDKSNIQEELHRTILRKASLIDKNKKNKKK